MRNYNCAHLFVLVKKHNSSISTESLESINNLFPWSTKYQRRNITNSGKIGTKSYESKLLYIILKRRKKGIQLFNTICCK